MCSHQVEAEVIVHSERSDVRREKPEGSERENDATTPSGPSLSEGSYSPLSPSSPSGDEATLQKLPLAQSPPGLASIKLVANHNGDVRAAGSGCSADSDQQRDAGLTNGFHSPSEMRCVLRPEQLESRDSRRCASAPENGPVPFVSAGLVHTSSAAHTYLCP